MTTSEILEQLLSAVPSNYETAPGSAFYDLLYPIAEYLGTLSETLLEIEASAFAKTAVGRWLEYKVAEQGIERRAAGFATGTVRISGGTGVIVNSGSLVASDDVIFTTNETITIPDIGYADVEATCTTAGTVGNVGVGQIYRFPITLPGLTAVYNPQTFTGGYNAETDEELRERYFEKVSRPNVSGNKNHYIEWAKEIAGVGEVWVIPLWNGPGTVKVLITDIENQIADESLITAVQTHIDECKPIGADVTVVSVEGKEVNITAVLDTDGRDFEIIESSIKDAISDYLTNEASSRMYVSYAKVCGLIMSVDGVEDCNELAFVDNGTQTTSGIHIDSGLVPVLGDLDVSVNSGISVAEEAEE